MKTNLKEYTTQDELNEVDLVQTAYECECACCPCSDDCCCYKCSDGCCNAGDGCCSNCEENTPDCACCACSRECTLDMLSCITGK